MSVTMSLHVRSAAGRRGVPLCGDTVACGSVPKPKCANCAFSHAELKVAIGQIEKTTYTKNTLFDLIISLTIDRYVIPCCLVS